MKITLEKLWNEYFAEECAAINTEEEKALMKKAIEMQKKANESLTKEQSDAIEKYIEVLYQIQGCYIKKAFFDGCEFATSFFFELGGFPKQ